MKTVIKRQSFTLVEIIAVLLVIGILAAVAAPKFVSLAATAREKVAQAGINEAKATLSVAYAKAYLIKEGTNPSTLEVISNAGLTNGTPAAFGDIFVNVVANADDVTIDLTAVNVNDTPVTGVTDTWNLPSN